MIVIVADGAGCGAHRQATTTTTTTTATTSPAPRTETVAHAKKRPARQVTAGERRSVAVVASAVRSHVSVYRSPHTGRAFLDLRNPTAVGAPLVFLVKRRRPGWDQVYLPIRPDGSTGWIRDRNVRLAVDPYSLQVLRRRHQLVLRKEGRVVARYRAAVGRSVLPTPTGRYFIVDLLKQPNPDGPYGPYAFGLSAFSKVLYHFGGGPGQIGIHGTNEKNSIGRSASHGCIRVPNHAIIELAQVLPLGTPVTIGA